MSTHGGKRSGAGRKVGAKTLLTKDISSEILASANPTAIWHRLLESKDEKIVLDALKYLSDRVWGKAIQAIDATVDGKGSIEVIVRHIGAEVLSAAPD